MNLLLAWAVSTAVSFDFTTTDTVTDATDTPLSTNWWGIVLLIVLALFGAWLRKKIR